MLNLPLMTSYYSGHQPGVRLAVLLDVGQTRWAGSAATGMAAWAPYKPRLSPGSHWTRVGMCGFNVQGNRAPRARIPGDAEGALSTGGDAAVCPAQSNVADTLKPIKNATWLLEL